MKHIGLISKILLLAVVCSCFITCSSSNDEDNGNNPFVGTWLGVFEFPGEVWYESYTFKSDGTGYIQDWEKSEGKSDFREFFKFSYTDKNITLDYDDGNPEIYSYSISGNKLWLSKESGSTYYKQ